MILSLTRLIYIFAALLSAAVLISCGGGGGGGSGAGTGTLSLGLTDAPGEYLHIFVTIKEIQVHRAAAEEGADSGWITAMEPNKTIDLKTLENGEIFDLGLAELGAGHYNQMRLILGTVPEPVEPIDDEDIQHPHANYLVIEGDVEGSGDVEPLIVPSGFQTGIKIVKGFEIVHEGTTALTLDFDAKKSVVKTGNNEKNEKWLLKPTIKVLGTVENSISGTVTDYDTESPLPGATVSAQIFDANGVVVESTVTETSGEGRYKFFLPPDVYGVVVTEDTHLPACQVVEALYYEDYIVNFSLFSRDTADINLTVNVTGVDEGESAFLSIRQPDFDCAVIGNGTIRADIEVALEPVANETYVFTLPALAAGEYYNLVAYTTDEIIEFTGVDPSVDIDVSFTPSP